MHQHALHGYLPVLPAAQIAALQRRAVRSRRCHQPLTTDVDVGESAPSALLSPGRTERAPGGLPYALSSAAGVLPCGGSEAFEALDEVSCCGLGDWFTFESG
jgi:hypothetical protein